MRRPPPKSTRTSTPVPYTTPCRSMSLTEIVGRLESIVDAVDIPVIGDADTGHGNALNAQHAMRAFERAGIAGCHLEDQVFPKRCGHYDNRSEEHTSELQSLMRISYAVFCLKKKK